jgi:hypothetical protein
VCGWPIGSRVIEWLGTKGGTPLAEQAFATVLSPDWGRLAAESSMRRFWRHQLILAVVLALLPASSLSACPNCKEAVSAQPAEVASMASGYNWSILLMLVVPASLLGTGALMVRRAVKLGRLPEM